MNEIIAPGAQRLLGPIATIAVAQLLATSLWFSANGVTDSLMVSWAFSPSDIGWLTSAVQGGFIIGTLFIAFSGLAERYRASAIFVFSCLTGSLFNAGFVLLSDGLTSAIAFRFLVGLSLAGIYPMGMKLIVSWAPERTGQAMGQLVAMLTLGTALPHGLRALGSDLPWQFVIFASSGLALLAALLIHLLGDGPCLRSNQLRTSIGYIKTQHHTVLTLFKINRYRAAAWGYFGHMWELYAFWTMVPLIVTHTAIVNDFPQVGVASLSFIFIGIGSLGCLLGGMLSNHFGSAAIATGALACSFICALLFILFWRDLSGIAMVILLSLWGMSVIADSPQFSTLSAKACPQELVGTALTIQNSIGFAITVVSISATATLFELIGLDAIWLLLPGPVLGLLGFGLAIRKS